MAKRIDKWLENRRVLLARTFGTREFTRKEATEVLKEKFGDDEKAVAAVLSELKQAGYLEIKPDPADARRTIYRLKEVRILEPEAEELTRDELESLLKKAADLIRTRVDYKFILILLFLKRISDKWEMEFQQVYEQLIREGLPEKEAEKEAKSGVYHDFDLPEEFLWENLRKDVARLPERLAECLKILAERNPELKDVVDRGDFLQFARSSENAEILRQLVELFSSRKLHRVSPDVLGDAYEWVLRYFAPEKAKEGEIYTPREVIKLLVEILNPKSGESVYDPACGSGGMLILSFKNVEEKEGREATRKLFLYGQEANREIFALCKMNMYIHDIRDVNIEWGDTLLYPKFVEGNRPKTFDVVMANPPWNQDGYHEEVLKKGEFWRERFVYGFPPRQSADWAWIQHMLASADERNGRVGVIIDNGCLFRGGKEKAIRSKIIEKDWIECVILTPEKLFYNTGAPGAIIIFNKNKPQERRNKILFINASNEFIPHPSVRRLNSLSKENIERIAEIYRRFAEVAGFSRVVDVKEVIDNDYNLNVTLYVMPVEEVEEIDIAKEFSELKELEKEREKVREKLEEYISELTKVIGD